MKEENSSRNKQTKTAKVLGLFMAAVLAAGSGGCASSTHKHVDVNRDGYCDEDGEPMSSSSGGYSDGYHHYYGSYGGTSPATTDVNGKSSSSGISTASSPKGGIGSHSTGSAGG